MFRVRTLPQGPLGIAEHGRGAQQVRTAGARPCVTGRGARPGGWTVLARPF